MSGPLLDVRDLHKRFPVARNLLGRPAAHVQAVDGVSFTIAEGETLGLVGESGSGKSTIARLITRLIEADAGAVLFDGSDVRRMSGRRLRAARRSLQMIFQDPRGSLDPRMSVAAILAEALRVHGGRGAAERRARSVELLQQVGLSGGFLQRRSDQLSGGQRQRVAVARVLATGARLIVCDEAVSALDVSVQAQVLNLLHDLQEDLGLSYLFIGHDLAVVRQMSDRIAVLYLGQIVEHGPAERIWSQPRHPYTQALLSAIPDLHPERRRRRERIVLRGDAPDPADPPPGCRFSTRCPDVMDMCRTTPPPLLTSADGSAVACHLHTEGPTLAGRSVTSLRPPGDAGAPVRRVGPARRDRTPGPTR